MGNYCACLAEKPTEVKTMKTDLTNSKAKTEAESEDFEMVISNITITPTPKDIGRYLLKTAAKGYMEKKDLIEEEDEDFPFENFKEPISKLLSSNVQYIENRYGEFAFPDIKIDSNDVEYKSAVILEDGSVYEGEWDLKTLKPHGKGILIDKNGTKYVGFFRQGKKDQYGRTICSDGKMYEGKFKHGKPIGKGLLVNENGEEFKGKCDSGFPNGKGIFKYSNGDVVDGEFTNGRIHGYAKLTKSDGSFYEGEFKDNHIERKGFYKWSNGNQYNGEWINGKMTGFGEFKFNDGKRYVGEFYRDIRNGYGEFFWPDGRIYKGNWVNGKQDGIGEFTFTDVKTKLDKTMKGEWVKGKRVKWL
ncbi:unnamed protein product [Blepharisma stoltei]|uniref:MORN repeat protein n=1 Tax=Blepharisma stoltei TaxID=1481888 RepID=A0AAU9JV57_9CILI|nr:unnamed protein product [Blepharisma stoltei]